MTVRHNGKIWNVLDTITDGGLTFYLLQHSQTKLMIQAKYCEVVE